MEQNGHDRSREALRREAVARRAALKRTAHALEDRVKEGTEKVSDAIERTRDRMSTVDAFIHRHRWALMAGASATGLVLGLRYRSRPRRRARYATRARNGTEVEAVPRTVYVTERPHDGSRSVLRSAAGTAAAMALRHAVQYAVDRVAGGMEEEREEAPPARLPGM